MSRSISGVLYVDSFISTGIEGEYTFENAVFNNQTDTTGNGAYDILIGYTLHCTATDQYTGVIIPGALSRYVFTNLDIIDTATISGTILWDMPLPVTDFPTNGVWNMVSQTTPITRLAIPPIDNIYPDLPAGSTLAVLINDIQDLLDNQGGGGNPVATTVRKTTTRLNVEYNGQTTFVLNNVPNDKTNCTISVNGLIYMYGMDGDYTINGDTITWTDASIVLETTDNITISYTY